MSKKIKTKKKPSEKEGFNFEPVKGNPGKFKFRGAGSSEEIIITTEHAAELVTAFIEAAEKAGVSDELVLSVQVHDDKDIPVITKGIEDALGVKFKNVRKPAKKKKKAVKKHTVKRKK